MCASRLEDLHVYRLADQLTSAIVALSASAQVQRDRRFCDQIRDAASSASRNCAEGFGRFRHKEFAHLLNVARGSTFEVTDLLREGVKRQYWTPPAIEPALRLSYRLIAAQTRFIRWLRTHPDVE